MTTMTVVVVECIYIQKRPRSWKHGPESQSLRFGGRRKWRRGRVGGWSRSM